MTFFNKKTEVMQIEMTPYGRYLYSIGKFKPHSYEFVDDDVVYKVSGSTEAQELAHQRIVNETPKLKINRTFQNLVSKIPDDVTIHNHRTNLIKMDQKIPNLRSLGVSSFSTDKSPSFEVSMLVCEIADSTATYNLDGDGNSINIP